MEFYTEVKKKIKVGSASKSKISLYNKCPLRAYKTLREVKGDFGGSKMLDIGMLAHELAAKEVYKLSGKEYNIEKLALRYPLEVIYEVQENTRAKVNFEKIFKDQSIISIEETFSIELPEIDKDFKLISKPDAIAFGNINGQPYVRIYDWKTGYGTINEIDSEAIIYAYAAYKKYSLPVIFARVSLTTGKFWSNEFSTVSLENMTPMLIGLLKSYKKDMENEVLPEFKPGSHCQYCPFITQCDGRKYVTTLRQKMKAAIWAKELAKKYENEVKNAAKEVLGNIKEPLKEGEIPLLPFLDNRYGAIANTSKSYQVASRKIKAVDILNLLIDSGLISNVVDNLKLKLDQDSANLLNSLQIPTKEVVKTTIKLEAVQGESEEEEEEGENEWSNYFNRKNEKRS